jgi:tetratricopeptide (TPR) repeat protein
MTRGIDRGLVLLQQQRHDLAEKEFRAALAEAPDDATAHAYLATCLIARDRYADALREADEAVRLDPSESFHHYVRGRALSLNKRGDEAIEAVRLAISIDPETSAYHGLLAAILLEKGKKKEALDAADEGLAFDPMHVHCLNVRAMALVQLGRKVEAGETLSTALSDNPEDGLTHANQGWTCLHRGDHKQALEHFREALRLEPDEEWARRGLIEALKARSFIYRVILGFFLWLQRQARAAQIAIILGLVFGPRILRGVGEAVPALAPWLALVAFLAVGLVLMSWVAVPLGNLSLMFSRFGRMALNRFEKLQAVVIGFFFLAALSCFLVGLASDNILWIRYAMFFGFMIFPVATAFRMRPGLPQWGMAAAAGAIALLGFSALVHITTGESGFLSDRQALSNWQNFIMLAVLSSWLPLFLSARGLTRD